MLLIIYDIIAHISIIGKVMVTSMHCNMNNGGTWKLSEQSPSILLIRGNAFIYILPQPSNYVCLFGEIFVLCVWLNVCVCF